MTIEPGTDIRSQGAGLIIEGKLMAKGNTDSIITFDTYADFKSWAGITFAGVKDRENKMEFVRMRNARIAVNCLSSSPLIERSEFTQNGDAMHVAGAFSKPLISKNAIL